MWVQAAGIFVTVATRGFEWWLLMLDVRKFSGRMAANRVPFALCTVVSA
jgi:hypothetical protein